MKNKFKRTYEVLKELPDIFVYILLILRIPFLKSDLRYKSKSKSKANKIHILGNGPTSLITYKNYKKDNEEVLCVNYFGLSSDFLSIKPKYYVLIDSVYFVEPNDKTLNLIDVFNRITWDFMLFIPSKYGKHYKKLITNNQITIQNIRMDYLPGNNKLVYYLYRHNLATPKFQNVIIACIYITVNKGFNNIYLHGVEASEFKNFIVNDKNEILLKTEHFYGINTINLTQENRVLKGEFWKFLSHYVIMLKEFSHVAQYSKSMGINVYNYTKNSYIDVFEKI